MKSARHVQEQRERERTKKIQVNKSRGRAYGFTNQRHRFPFSD